MPVKMPIRESAAAFAAASVEELIYQLRAEDTDYPDPSFQRTQLERYISAATDWVANYTGRIILDGEYSVYFDGFSATCLPLGFYPARTLTAVNYQDTAGDWQVLGAESYSADLYALRPRVAATNGWPSTATGYNTVKFTVQAGYADAASIPQPLKAAILMLAAHLEQNALAAAPVKLEEVPLGVRALADHYRVDWA